LIFKGNFAENFFRGFGDYRGRSVDFRRSSRAQIYPAGRKNYRQRPAPAKDCAMRNQLTTILVTFAAVSLVLSTMGEAAPIFIWNASESVPIGLYRLRPTSKRFVTELVAVQPPETLAAFLSEGGYLPRNVPMLKRVLALPGQTVCRRGPTITVDNIEMGQARERDGRGRPLPVWQGCHVVADDEVFLMNWQSVESLDGRYFGVLPAAAIVGQAEPLWTDEED
jgi:conjugative transfer signal peptidase TraF